MMSDRDRKLLEEMWPDLVGSISVNIQGCGLLPRLRSMGALTECQEMQIRVIKPMILDPSKAIHTVES